MELDKAYNDSNISDSSLFLMILNGYFENKPQESICEYLDDMLNYCQILYNQNVVTRPNMLFVSTKINELKTNTNSFLSSLKECLAADNKQGHILFLMCYYRNFWEKNLQNFTLYDDPKYAINTILNSETAWFTFLEAIKNNTYVVISNE